MKFNVLGSRKPGKQAFTVLVLCVSAAIALPAQTFTTLYSFCSKGLPCADGANPSGGLVQATNGYFYGTTEWGDFAGTVFKITPSGTLTKLSEFSPSTGYSSAAGLIQATNGYLYGTASNGGAGQPGTVSVAGTVFKTTPSGTLTAVYSFCQGECLDGDDPVDGLVQAANGYLYGTTHGGVNDAGVPYSYGAVIKMTPSGTLTPLHTFCPQGQSQGCTDGAYPYGSLVQAANGDLYGTTSEGGTGTACAGGCGTVFKITPSGALTTLYNFCSPNPCTDGIYPYAGLVQGTNGDFYGTTYGDSSIGLYGTVFKITQGGTLTLLHTFSGADGEFPYAGLIEGTDGDLYGTTLYGGAHGGIDSGGTLFKITPGGKLTTLYSFCFQSQCTDGEYPYGALMQATNGDFYGTTAGGGSDFNCPGMLACGTVFRLSTGLGPFVKTLPTAGVVGETVKILGTDLTGATSVSFNGTVAEFTVASGAEITTTVPAGATTGTVEVVTPSGTLSSNVSFRVLP